MGNHQSNKDDPKTFRDESLFTGVELPHGQLVILNSLAETMIHLLEQFQHQIRLAIQQSRLEEDQISELKLDDAIHAVDLLFSILLFDTTLPETTKLQIARLQTLYVKIAVSDHSFYTKDEHPARKLLAYLTQQAKQDIDEGQPNHKLSSAIEQILQNYDTNPDIIHSVMQQLRTQPDPPQSKLDMHRHEKANLGKDLDALVKAYINTTLQSGSVINLPEQVKAFVQGPWKAYLYSIAINQGLQSEKWDQAKQDLVAILRLCDTSFSWDLQQREETLARTKPIIVEALSILMPAEQEREKWLQDLDKAFAASLSVEAPPDVVQMTELSQQQSFESTANDSIEFEEDTESDEKAVKIPKNFPEKSGENLEEIEITMPSPFGKS